MPPGDLEKALCGLEVPSDANLIVGLERADDAGVYRISDELALVQTVDFFTPIVDDPYGFGQIAAANALSDIYAMGGVPKTAMNLVGFPLQTMDLSVLRTILQGGLDKIKEAGVVLVGGHSVEDPELKYGLAVTGFVHPQRILTKRGLAVGDRLILTKPLGTGIINTAIKGGLATGEIVDRVTRLMATLNRDAATIMREYPVHACTDITGFGLLGHLAEMISDAEAGLEIRADRVPILPEAFEFAAMGMVPGGAGKNREFRQGIVDFSACQANVLRDVLFDPQTSGGLLICVAKEAAEDLLARLIPACERAALVGEVVAEPKGRIRVS
jgi:selenide,water dikinase